jgi:hypothetical protein
MQLVHLLVLFLFQEEMGISCELLESDFLKCSVGFPFMRSKSKVRDRDGALPWLQTPQFFPPTTDSTTVSLRFLPSFLPPMVAGVATKVLSCSRGTAVTWSFSLNHTTDFFVLLKVAFNHYFRKTLLKCFLLGHLIPFVPTQQRRSYGLG